MPVTGGATSSVELLTSLHGFICGSENCINSVNKARKIIFPDLGLTDDGMIW